MTPSLSHAERTAAARDVIAYLASRTPQEMQAAVPNCPGWTVRNALVHVGRVGIAWRAMMQAGPDDPESRNRGYAESELKPEGAPVDEIASWAYQALDLLDGEVDRSCYFSMTGGAGTIGDWGWHAATELGLHRLDVESALGHGYSMSDAQALDALAYSCELFLPAFRRATDTDPGSVAIEVVSADGAIAGSCELASDTRTSVSISGPGPEILLALWGRNHANVTVAAGDAAVLAAWAALPGQAFQFGTWD